MNCKVQILAALSCAAVAFADPASAPDKSPINFPDVKDPRTGGEIADFPLINFLNKKQAVAKAPPADSLLIFARWDSKPPNQILGVEGRFSDEQIVAALKKFYQEWRPSADQPKAIRPNIVLAMQNWGVGSTLYDPLKALSVQHSLDIYLYPAISKFEPSPKYPAPNDKRVGEFLKNK